MGKISKDFNFVKIKNFLDKSEIILLNKYCQIKHRLNTTNFDFKFSNTYDTAFYGDPAMESLLLTKQNLIEKKLNVELLPTYSYWRMYTKHAILKNHKDRPSCEVSLTVHIGNNVPDWPIYMENEKVITKPGDAIIYLGSKINHRRDEFFGDWHTQCFLHYVLKNGKYANNYMDKRPYWGITTIEEQNGF